MQQHVLSYDIATARYFMALRARAKAPYGGYVSGMQADILCFSPEQFLQVQYPYVITKPIKGTRPRGFAEQEDLALKTALVDSEKDRAENVMIVDLLRNDLSRVCAPGSVKTPELFAVESYENVHHLVSTVTGELDQGVHPAALLRACFPGGSITGAPKCHVMQIIEELEPHRRSVYCGSLGYIGYDWRMDTNICIRTMVHAAGRAYCWAGGGIVADSQAEAEYQETLDKVRHLCGFSAE